jgi:hypothetical protein
MEGFIDKNKVDMTGRKVELAFPRYEHEEDDQYISKGGTGEGLVKHFSTSIDSIAHWFKQYEVESIELWISGMMESGGITKLVISAKGEGGLKVILKPKSLVETPSNNAR